MKQPFLQFRKMEELLYSDPHGKYFLLDYSPSHSELVIRRSRGHEDNIDLFFKAVDNININVKLKGIHVSKVSRPDLYLKNNSFNKDSIFKIADDSGQIFYIDAGLFVLFKNNLKLLETSLGDFTWTDGNIEVLFSKINEK